MLAVAIATVATFLLLPKRYRISEHLAQTVVFWNPKEAFLFVTIQTSGRATNILQDKFAHTSYGYTAILLGGNVFFYKQDTIAYHLLPSGKLDRFPLPETTAAFGSWTLRDGKLQLTPAENRFNQGSGFRWDGEKFVTVPSQAKSQPAASGTSQTTEGDEDYDDEHPGFLSASDREK